MDYYQEDKIRWTISNFSTNKPTGFDGIYPPLLQLQSARYIVGEE